MNTKNKPEVATGNQVGGTISRFEAKLSDDLSDGFAYGHQEIYAASAADALREFISRSFPDKSPESIACLLREAQPLQGGVPGLGVWFAQYAVTVVPVAGSGG